MSSNVIDNRIRQLTADFQKDADWEAKYRRVIEMGKKLGEFPPEFRSETYKVKGCQSQVWLHAKLGPEQKIEIIGDSDALIVRGLVACLLFVYSGATAEEILKTKPTFLSDIGFDTHLSPSRANGLNAMLKQIYLYATAFKALAGV